jgi:M6 family metalloprotease-like protein
VLQTKTHYAMRTKMKRKLWLSVLVLAIITSNLHAAYLTNVKQTLKQPDGSILNCLASGDEYYHWLHDSLNFTIVKDKQTGFFVYADQVDGKLVPTALIPGIDNPENYGIPPGLKISKEEYLQRREEKYQEPALKGMSSVDNIGTLNNIVIFIRFSDQSEFTSNLSTYSSAFNGIGSTSVYEYFNEVSDNQIDVLSTFYPTPPGSTVVSYQDANPRDYYSEFDATTNPIGYNGDSELRTREHTLLKNATESVAAEILATGLDFDFNNDNEVDNICYIIQGPTDGWAELLWPHKWALYSQSVYIGALRVYDYNFQLSESFGVSVLCHELFHTMSAPDLYRYSDRDITPIGPWDLMAYNRTPPQHMGVHMKYKYGGWTSAIPTITTSGTYTLEPLSTNPFAAYRINSPNSSTEYFVVEYRRDEGRFESGLSSSGLLVYRINDNIRGNASGPPDELYLYRPGGTTTEDGDVYSANYASNFGRTEISYATSPTPFLSDGSPGGLIITNITNIGDDISFDVLMSTVLDVSPALRNVEADAGSTTFDVENVGSGTMNWTASVTSGGSWLSISSGSSGTNSGTITCDYSENSNTSSRTGTIRITAAGASGSPMDVTVVQGGVLYPDLYVQDLDASIITLAPGEVTQLSGRMGNSGDSDVVSAYDITVYLSINTAVSGDDAVLTTFSGNPYNVGQFEDFAGTSVTIPPATDAGNYYIIYKMDSGNDIFESELNNNTDHVLVHVEIPASYSDIYISNLSLDPTEAEPGETIIISGETGNNGQVVIPDPYAVQIALSDDPTFSLDDEVLDQFAGELFEAGESDNFNDWTVELPGDIQPGTWYIVVDVDIDEEIEEYLETNNSASSLFTVPEPTFPDLYARSLDVSPASVRIDESFEVSVKLGNEGNADVTGAYTYRVLLSANQTVGVGDYELAQVSGTQYTAGQSETLTGITYNIPVGPTPGSWYILWVMDNGNDIEESEETDNMAVTPITLTEATFPDLYVMNIDVTPNQVRTDESFEISCRMGNQGNEDITGAWSYRILLSENQTADGNDTELDLVGGDQYQAGVFEDIDNLTFDVPPGTEPGQWYIIWIMDVGNAIDESDETDNTAVIPVTLLAPTFPDVFARSLVVNPNQLETDESFELSVELGNDGDADVNNPYTYRVVLSANQTLEGTDYLLTEAAGNPYTVGQNEIISGLTFDVPAGAAPGLWYVIWMMDIDGDLDESDENNNTAIVPVTLTPPTFPDLFAENLSVLPNSVETDDSFSLSVSLGNEGDANVNSPYQYRILISNDQNPDAGDTQLLQASGEQYNAGQQESITDLEFGVPAGFDAGSWFILWIMDVGDNIDEWDESNNIALATIELLDPTFPDLYADNLALTVQSVEADESFEVSVDLGNSGDADVTGSYQYQLLLSSDQNPDAGDYQLTAANGVNYAAGQNESIASLQFMVPQGITPGNWFVIWRIDVDNDIIEWDEANNIQVVPLTILEPTFVDLYVLNLDINPDAVEIGETISLAGEIGNQGDLDVNQSYKWKVVLSNDNVVSEDDYLLDEKEGAQFATGEYETLSGNSYLTPESATAGQWYVIFTIDSENNIEESAEHNNQLAVPVQLNEPTFPDLFVEQLVLDPTTVTQGDPIDLTANWGNKGDRDAGSFVIRYVFSRDDVFSTGDILVEYDPVESLSTNSYENLDTQLEIPEDMETGLWYLLVTVDCFFEVEESIEFNNSALGQFTVIPPPQPELTVTPAFHEVSYTPGSCDFTVTNTGTGDMPWTATVIAGGEWIDLTSFSGTNTGTISCQFDENPDLDPRVGVIRINAGDATGSPIDVQIQQEAHPVRLPDLILSQIISTPDRLTEPGDAEVSVLCQNIGEGASAAASIQIYLSTTTGVEDQIADFGSIACPPLEPGGQAVVETTVTVNSEFTDGSFYLIAVMDPDDDIKESDENNNLFFSILNIALPVILDSKSGLTEMLVYPVPANELLTINLRNHDNLKGVLRMMDPLGRILFSKAINDSKQVSLELDVRYFAKGSYWLVFSSEKEQLQKRIIVQ